MAPSPGLTSRRWLRRAEQPVRQAALNPVRSLHLHARNLSWMLQRVVPLLRRVIAGRRARARALDTAMDELDARLHRIGQHPFRAKFRLRGRDRAVVDLRGITTVRRHAEQLVEHRLAPAQPRNDGRQTPYRGHPVFVAQHATATCCRTCLARWHGIPAGHPLDEAECGYVVEAICRWIVGQYAPHRPPP